MFSFKILPYYFVPYELNLSFEIIVVDVLLDFFNHAII